MTPSTPDRIEVRATTDHVEVFGLSVEDVQSAIQLYQAVADSKLNARSFYTRGLSQPGTASQWHGTSLHCNSTSSTTHSSSPTTVNE